MVSKFPKDVIIKTYCMIKDHYDKYLESYGVKMPKLKLGGKYTKDALILVYLAQGYPKTRTVSKSELTQFIRHYDPDITDVQQARHLGAQKGWFIVAGGRDNKDADLDRGEYRLISLERPYPVFHGRRIQQTDNWKSTKTQYGHRCATCGSEEGKPNIHWPNTITKLQKSHMDPNKPLIAGNIIPQCQKCNRADRNNWVYDERGRVIKVANPNIITRSDEIVKKAMYKILYEQFRGINSNET